MIDYGDENLSQLTDFAARPKRMVFVRKVLVSVMACLVLIAIVAGLIYFMNREYLEVRRFVHDYYWVGYVAGAFYIILTLIATCCRLGYGPPNACNILILFLSTASCGIFVGFMIVNHHLMNIIYSFATTMVILLVIVILTLTTKLDITSKGMYLWVISTGLVIGGFCAVLLFQFPLCDATSCDTRPWKIFFLVFNALMAILFALYVLYDLQQILGGRTYEVSEQDWLWATINLTSDVVFLFLTLFRIIVGFSND